MAIKAADYLNGYKEQVLAYAKTAKPVKEPVITTIADELNPLLTQIGAALTEIAGREQLQPIVDVKPESPIVNVSPPEVQVEVQAAKTPAINNVIELNDYTESIKTLIVAVNEMTDAIRNRPLTWEVERNNRGFIEKINGTTEQ